MKVLSVVGNRPQFIKSGPVSVALREAGIEEVVLHTGQHYDPQLSQVFFDELGLAEPQYRLEVGGLARDEMLEALAPDLLNAIEQEHPDWVLVYGDTNSTLGGARAAAQAGVALAHVEAGLRSYDLSMPEEHNRVETDGLSQLLFCPDERSRGILEGEGVDGRIEVVGDVMADACFRFAPIARERSSALDMAGVRPLNFVLATLHREANVQPERVERILQGLSQIEEPIVFPAHPRTRAAIGALKGQTPSQLRLLSPLGYLDLAALASQARVIVTDSGGLQKEAYWYGVPCVTARPSTEWVDTIEVGANVLVDADPDRLVEAVRNARMPADRPALYGDGNAAGRVAAALYASAPE
ncbi:MAG TPA: UDP-N-acetylglucosamine 2-epimerase (non-hydrolyzing) [Gaiellaceae bacterium]|nr:UDP-N-acetylglucosamine 2-epimerase (non-hydrolyzing) [Gaiellaceae bacterium]